MFASWVSFKRNVSLLLVLGLLGTTVGCSALDVNSPTTIRMGDVANSASAALVVKGARLYNTMALESAIASTGSMTDEFGVGDFWEPVNFRTDIWVGHELYGKWQEAYRRATMALAVLRASGPSSAVGPHIAEVLSLRGFAMLGLAEHICPGFPVIQLDIKGEAINPIFTSDPQTTDSAFARALADFDSALVYAADTGRVRHLAQIGRGRALLGLGRFADASSAVTSVPTAFTDTATSVQTLYFKFLYGYPVQNREGINGLDFVSATDPRVELVDHNGDGSWYAPRKYYDGNFTLTAPMVLASGIEARLIEAEGQLAASPLSAEWLTTLNTLRATVGLADTTDPGTATTRVDLLYRERAFWLFGTAHRLGDLRRLMSRYGRAQDAVFPTGTNYGTWTSFPFDGPREHAFNPKITGCTSN